MPMVETGIIDSTEQARIHAWRCSTGRANNKQVDSYIWVRTSSPVSLTHLLSRGTCLAHTDGHVVGAPGWKSRELDLDTTSLYNLRKSFKLSVQCRSQSIKHRSTFLCLIRSVLTLWGTDFYYQHGRAERDFQGCLVQHLATDVGCTNSSQRDALLASPTTR